MLAELQRNLELQSAVCGIDHINNNENPRILSQKKHYVKDEYYTQ